jgi:hypothetical protein
MAITAHDTLKNCQRISQIHWDKRGITVLLFGKCFREADSKGMQLNDSLSLQSIGEQRRIRIQSMLGTLSFARCKFYYHDTVRQCIAMVSRHHDFVRTNAIRDAAGPNARAVNALQWKRSLPYTTM